MGWPPAERFERLADGMAALCLGGAMGVVAFQMAAPVAAPVAARFALCAAAAAMACWTGWRLLRLVPRTPLRAAKVADLPTAAAHPDSRVVRLFDPAPAPPSDRSAVALREDASGSLYEALDQLRRSLR